MKRLITGLLLCLVIATGQVAWADTTSTSTDAVTQSNSSGSNTSISGGYSAETTNNFTGGQTNSTTSSTNNNAYTGDQRVVNSSTAPSMSAMSQDLCLVGVSGGVSTFGLGISGGSYTRDENCERIKLSKVLNDLGMKVAAVSILCQDPRVFYAMEQSGTPCPFEGKIGKDAQDQWKKYGKLRPDFDKYTDRLKVVEKANKEWEIKMKDKDEVIAKQATEISKNETEQKKLELELEQLKKKNQQ
jgi:hypothetical protein